jgi:hypothetical protein
MSLNVHFTNLQITDFVSKNARNRMKTYIKQNLNQDNINSFDELKLELINKYLKDDDVHDLDLKYTLENNDLKLTLEKTESESYKKDQLRRKLRDQIKNKRNNGLTQRQFLKQQKQENKTLAKDDRVTQDMINAYTRAKITINKDIPNPINVLDNKDKYVDEVFQHLLNLSQKCPSKEKLMEIMDNDYINYIQLVCGFDYKKYIEQFFRKVKEMSNSESELPEMIRNTSDNKVEENDLNEKVMTQLDDSDDDKVVIDSDDENDDSKDVNEVKDVLDTVIDNID